MSSQTLPRAKKSAPRKRKKNSQTGVPVWLPLVVGVVITLLAVKTAEILPLMGPGGLLKLQLLYPYALLLKLPQLGLSEATSELWSQVMLYAQWTFYGIYVAVMMRRKSLGLALMQVAVLHLLGCAMLWLFSWK
jgi:hypothetical protein